MTPRRRRVRGFTLVELTVALVLLALLAAVLFGSLNLAGTSVERGEAKVDATSGMRLAQAFIRANLEQQHPLRMRKIAEFPLLFAGQRDELRYAAPLPARVAGGGLWYYRISVATGDARSPLVLERTIPDLNDSRAPEFREAERSILAQDIAEIRIDVRPKRGPAWPTLVVQPREAPEAGCRSWDAARLRCAAI